MKNKSTLAGAILFIIIILVAQGCTRQSNGINAKLGQEFDIALGQNAAIPGENLSIKFTKLVSDSRCPTGVQCIWQGEVSCLIELGYEGNTFSKVLTQSGLTGGMARTDFKSYEIAFAIEPYPEAGKSINQKNYRLQLLINKIAGLS